MTDNDPLLTTAEVADELRIDLRGVYRLFRDNKLVFLDLGYRSKRVRRSALDAYLLECEGAGNGASSTT